jgi:hypothetical protein
VLDAEAQQLQGELQAAVEARKAAEEAERLAAGRYAAANADRHDGAWDLGAAKRELAAHIASGVQELGHAAPLMRAAWLGTGRP